MNPKAPSYSKVEFISSSLIYAFLCHGAYTEVATDSLIGCYHLVRLYRLIQLVFSSAITISDQLFSCPELLNHFICALQ